VLEWMFSIHGMGVYTVTSMKQSDFPTVQGFVLVIATALVATNLLVDLTYGWLDPRVRFQEVGGSLAWKVRGQRIPRRWRWNGRSCRRGSALGASPCEWAFASRWAP